METHGLVHPGLSKFRHFVQLSNNRIPFLGTDSCGFTETRILLVDTGKLRMPLHSGADLKFAYPYPVFSGQPNDYAACNLLALAQVTDKNRTNEIGNRDWYSNTEVAANGIIWHFKLLEFHSHRGCMNSCVQNDRLLPPSDGATKATEEQKPSDLPLPF